MIVREFDLGAAGLDAKSRLAGRMDGLARMLRQHYPPDGGYRHSRRAFRYRVRRGANWGFVAALDIVSASRFRLKLRFMRAAVKAVCLETAAVLAGIGLFYMFVWGPRLTTSSRLNALISGLGALAAFGIVYGMLVLLTSPLRRGQITSSEESEVFHRLHDYLSQQIENRPG